MKSHDGSTSISYRYEGWAKNSARGTLVLHPQASQEDPSRAGR